MAIEIHGSYVSALNAADAARAGLRLPARVIVNDTSLREGEQTADVNFSPNEKLVLARALDAAGVPQIQVGYPGRSEADRGVFEQLKREGVRAALEAVVLSYVDTWREQIDAAAGCGADVIGLVYVTSDLRREHAFKVSREAALERLRAAIEHGKRRGLVVAFAPADTTRTDLAYLEQVIQASVEAGADRLTIADTLGAAGPHAMRYLVRWMRERTNLPIEVHCHNDFGLALANSIAAVEEGAEIVDVAINGLGDRAGNALLDELVSTLEILYQVETGIDLAQLCALSQLVAEHTRIPIPNNKAISGENAFAHKLETHVQAVLAYPPAFEALNPAAVGNQRRIVVGRYTGPVALTARLNQIGIEPPAGTMDALLREVEQEAVARKRSLSDDELRQIVERVRRAGKDEGSESGIAQRRFRDA